MQNITICGRLGRNAVVKETTSGQRFLTFTVAVNSRIRGAEKTTWYEVISFQEQHMRSLVNYLTKGSVVIVTGDLDSSIQVGTDGVSRLRLSINTDRIDFTPSNQSGATQTTAVVQETAQAPASKPAEADVPEDIVIPKAKPKKVQVAVEEAPAESSASDDSELPF